MIPYSLRGPHAAPAANSFMRAYAYKKAACTVFHTRHHTLALILKRVE